MTTSLLVNEDVKRLSRRVHPVRLLVPSELEGPQLKNDASSVLQAVISTDQSLAPMAIIGDMVGILRRRHRCVPLTGLGASFRKAVQDSDHFLVSGGKMDGLHWVWVAVCERRAERSHNQHPSKIHHLVLR